MVQWVEKRNTLYKCAESVNHTRALLRSHLFMFRLVYIYLLYLFIFFTCVRPLLLLWLQRCSYCCNHAFVFAVFNWIHSNNFYTGNFARVVVKIVEYKFYIVYSIFVTLLLFISLTHTIQHNIDRFCKLFPLFLVMTKCENLIHGTSFSIEHTHIHSGGSCW